MNNKIANTYTSISVHTILTLAWVHEHNRSKGLPKITALHRQQQQPKHGSEATTGLHEQEAQT